MPLAFALLLAPQVWQYGADSLRLYEMFMGPLRDTKVRGASGPCSTNKSGAFSSQLNCHGWN